MKNKVPVKQKQNKNKNKTSPWIVVRRIGGSFQAAAFREYWHKSTI